MAGGIGVTWTQRGHALDGTITMDGTACLSSGVVRGTVSGLRVDFSVVQREVIIDFVGRISSATMSGTFSTGCDIGKGKWTMRKTG